MRVGLVGSEVVGLFFRDFGVRFWLGFWGGSPKKSVEYFGVDFGACEWCGTTTGVWRGRGVAVNVNIPPSNVYNLHLSYKMQVKT